MLYPPNGAKQHLALLQTLCGDACTCALDERSRVTRNIWAHTSEETQLSCHAEASTLPDPRAFDLASGHTSVTMRGYAHLGRGPTDAVAPPSPPTADQGHIPLVRPAVGRNCRPKHLIKNGLQPHSLHAA